MAAGPYPAVAGEDPACSPPDSEATIQACVRHRGNNKIKIRQRGDVRGGDALAGSQVINITGANSVQIEAHNRSEHASARGGDAKIRSSTRIDIGPRVEIGRPAFTPEAAGPPVLTETAVIAETGAPVLAVTLSLVSAPNGTPPLMASTVSPATELPPAPITRVVVNGLLPQSQFVLNNPEMQNTLGSAEYARTIPPTVPSQAVTDSPGALELSSTPLNASNTLETATFDDPGDQTVRSPATPSSNSLSSPPVIHDVRHIGRNEVSLRRSIDLVGGMAAAGSQVIGLAGIGEVTVNATNSSRFARSRGGDASALFRDRLGAGPQLAAPARAQRSVQMAAFTEQKPAANLSLGVAAHSPPTGSTGVAGTATPTLTGDLDPQPDVARLTGGSDESPVVVEVVADVTIDPRGPATLEAVFSSTGSALPRRGRRTRRRLAE